MSDIVKGKLIKPGDDKLRRIIFPTKKGMSIATPISRTEIHPSLLGLKDAEVEVDLEMIGGLPKQVRPVGQLWSVAPAPVAPNSVRTAAPSAQISSAGAPGTGLPPAFHNPYNFIPAPDRDISHPELGDHAPPSHAVLSSGRYTGKISVKLTTATPMLIPDAANATADTGAEDHKLFPMRMANGKPYLPPTSVKGMLSSAYEAITNSRMRVFEGHDAPLAYRRAAADGIRMVPCRIQRKESGLEAELLSGYSEMQNDGRPEANHEMYAAWLPMYREHRRQWTTAPKHGDRVCAFLTKWEYNNNNNTRFSFWNVVDFRPFTEVKPTDTPIDARKSWPHAEPTGEKGFWASGYICINNCNINSKHDERVFFSYPNQRPLVSVTEDVWRGWTHLIRNYETEHEVKIRQGALRPPALKEYCEWSRHIVDATSERELRDGTLCYAEVQKNREGKWDILALVPVMISRRLYKESPLEFLDSTLQPALTIDQLSPADRVFGWVVQGRKGGQRAAYAGNLRVGPTTCETPNVLRRFEGRGLPLSILGQPKPAQGRFYLAGPTDQAQSKGISKEQAGYSGDKRLRRKVYPHHAQLPANYWDVPATGDKKTVAPDRFREFLRVSEVKPKPGQEPSSDRDKQNRSISGWVEAKTEFTFDIHVTNLSAVELGALLWLLTLPPEHFHRLGGGKPLGFGSVRLELVSSELHTGEQWAEGYLNLDEPQGAVDISGPIAAYRAAVAGPGRFETVPYIAAFLKCATGFADGLPTRYPRADADPSSELYEWFTRNERSAYGRVENGHSLPDLATDPGLPYLPPPPRDRR